MIKKALNLYIYSSLHIALGAVCLSLHSYVLNIDLVNWNYIWFLFCSTIALYGLHRLIGIRKLRDVPNQGRFEIITIYYKHILFYTATSSLALLYFISQLDLSTIKIASVPVLLSLIYVLPVLGNGKRLRDLHFVKIFLIALSWSWLTSFIPLFQTGFVKLAYLMSIERFLFFIAITIPFDVRDFQIDKRSNVKTLVSALGVNTSYLLSHIILLLASVLALVLIILKGCSIPYGLSLLGTHVLTHMCIHWSKGSQNDYYFSGLLDATMFLPFLIYNLLVYLFL